LAKNADRSVSLLPGVRGVLASVTIGSDVTKLRHRVTANNSRPNEAEMSQQQQKQYSECRTSTKHRRRREDNAGWRPHRVSIVSPSIISALADTVAAPAGRSVSPLTVTDRTTCGAAAAGAARSAGCCQCQSNGVWRH